jgi:hypothetical protein
MCLCEGHMGARPVRCLVGRPPPPRITQRHPGSGAEGALLAPHRFLGADGEDKWLCFPVPGWQRQTQPKVPECTQTLRLL